MKRRAFLTALFAAPLVPAAANATINAGKGVGVTGECGPEMTRLRSGYKSAEQPFIFLDGTVHIADAQMGILQVPLYDPRKQPFLFQKTPIISS